MNTKNSKKKKANSEPEEALSPLLTLMSGKKGPLPIESTDGGTPSSGSGANSDLPYQDLIQQLMQNHPGLTEEEALEAIDAFG